MANHVLPGSRRDLFVHESEMIDMAVYHSDAPCIVIGHLPKEISIETNEVPNMLALETNWWKAMVTFAGILETKYGSTISPGVSNN